MIEINEPNFRANRMCYIQADKEKNKEQELGDTGIKLFIDAEAGNRQHHKETVTQDGIVMYPAAKCDSGLDIQIKKGDHVYTHHFLCDDENAVMINGVLCYEISYDAIYCVIEGANIRMLNKWSFAEPIEEDESNYKTESGIYTKSTVDNVLQKARMVYPSEEMKRCGVKKGDIVIYYRVGGYEMIVEGETYYRLEDRHIEIIDNHGEAEVQVRVDSHMAMR